MVPCDTVPRTRLAVILSFGGTNSTNSGRGNITTAGHVYNFNWYTGHCAVAADPLLGTVGLGANFATRLGQELVGAKLYDDVLLVTVGTDYGRIDDWSPYGSYIRRLFLAEHNLRKAGFEATFLLWQHGDLNYSDGLAYRSLLGETVAMLRDHGIRAPLFAAVGTWCDGLKDYETRDALQAIVNPQVGVYAGPDTDSLGNSFRWDRCRFSEDGVAAQAKLWFLTLQRFLSGAPAELLRTSIKGDAIGIPEEPERTTSGVPRGGPLHGVYSAYRTVQAPLSLDMNQDPRQSGENLFEFDYLPKHRDSVLKIHIRLNVYSPVAQDLRLSLSRYEDPRPAWVGFQRLGTGQSSIVEASLDLRADSDKPLKLAVRAGTDEPGHGYVINGDPGGPETENLSTVDVVEDDE